MHHNQIQRGQLALLQNRKDPVTVELNALCLAQAAALDARPEPRGPLDDLARAEARVVHPAARAIEISRRCARKALAEGGAEKVAATRAHIEAYYDGCKAAALRDLPAEPALSVTTTYLVALRESGEAVHAAATAREVPDRMHVAIREAKEAARAWLSWIAAASHHAHPQRAAR